MKPFQKLKSFCRAGLDWGAAFHTFMYTCTIAEAMLSDILTKMADLCDAAQNSLGWQLITSGRLREKRDV